MRQEQLNEFGRLLQGLAESLDISETQYEDAVIRYKAVGDWLSKENSSIAQDDPIVYPQGSFRLGTMIKPVNDRDEYDIDLVCELKNLRKEHGSQQQLKDKVGNRLKENETYKKMLEEGKRCWTLTYAESSRFHMDILPAIPDHDINGIGRIVGANLTRDAILITDKELRAWQCSNPIGYAEWFKQQMLVRFNETRKQIAFVLNESVESVPDYKIKTPLQRAIQLLKRHRDVMYTNAHNQDDKPISIIITTLAAKVYNNETDLIDALLNISNNMWGAIEWDNGIAKVINPVNPLENFADKWQQYPKRRQEFQRWIVQVQKDLKDMLSSTTYDDLSEKMKSSFGDRVTNKTISNYPFEQFNRKASAASIAPSIIISTTSKPWGSDKW